MATFNFNLEKPSPEDIERMYEDGKAGIELYFDSERNPSYHADLATLTEKEIIERKGKELEELSLRSSFFLLAYIESLFRTDFILRIKSHNKGRNDELTGLYRKIYNPALRPYTYSLKDVIFDNWKLYVDETIMSEEMQVILRSLPQYFDFRNWMAHGRYWRFKERNYMKKYNYPQIRILLANIEHYFGPFLKKVP